MGGRVVDETEKAETIEEMAVREFKALRLLLPDAWEKRVIALLVKAYRWSPK